MNSFITQSCDSSFFSQELNPNKLKVEATRISEVQALEVVQYHCSFLLLIKVSRKTSPDLRRKELTLSLYELSGISIEELDKLLVFIFAVYHTVN